MRMFTTESKEKLQQRLVAWGLGGGIVLVICSGFFTYLMAVSSVYRATYTRDPNTGKPGDMGNGPLVWLGMAGIFIGVCICLFTLGFALFKVKNRNAGPRQMLRSCRILARFAATRDGLLYYDQDQIEHLEKVTYHVRILSNEQGSVEYECDERTFFSCGEGMIGDAEVQGAWLGAFRGQFGNPNTGVGTSF